MIKKNRTFLKPTAWIMIVLIFTSSIRTDVFALPDNTQEIQSEEQIEGGSDDSAISQMIDVSDMTEIRISSVDDFNEFAKKCRLDTWSIDKYVILTNDLDGSTKKIEQVPTFGGVFEGNNHSVINASFTEKECYSALFSKTAQTAVIRNLNLAAVVKPGGKIFDVGGIVGDNYGLIANCNFDGYVEGYDYVGAIVGYNEVGAVVSNCTVKGQISGRHYVGGIAGANAGLITGCSSNAEINTVNKEEETSIGEIKVEQILTSIITNVTQDEDKNKDINSSQNPIDIGGIAGYNFGEISSCANSSQVGYEHVGYNVGGIAGRQSGYIHDCKNDGLINGRKDIGGIVGQAEPYIRLDLTEDIIEQLTDNINGLHDSLDKTIHDSDNTSDVVASRLNVIKDFTDKALSDTGYLANGTQDFVNGIMATTNEASDRIQYIVSETSKNDGALAEIENAGEDIEAAADNVEDAVEDLDIYNYMSRDEAEKYDDAKHGIKNASKEYRGYVDAYKDTPEYQAEYDIAYYKALDDLRDARYEEYRQSEWNSKYKERIDAGDSEANARIAADEWKNDPSVISAAEAAADAYRETQEAKDLANAAATEQALEGAADYASAQYTLNHPGHNFANDMKNDATTVAATVIDHVGDMASDARDDSKEAVENAERMARNLKNAAGDFKATLRNVADRGTLQFPQLSEEYRGHSDSLVANLQGMSDNLGFLNNEMNGSTDVICDDMEEVNDRFNKIMLLFTDAMDGALDKDYSDVYEDESNDVAQECVDATVTKCINFGEIEGDINTGGIAGTMAEEYEFDLESDTTGVSDSSRISTYLTKCVLRDDVNRGEVKGQKSYVGGAVGLQEIGTVLRCENYAKVSSDSGDYTGGIAGRSYSTIRQSSAKCILSGNTYVGGITGCATELFNCVAMPTVLESGYFTGAIAGDMDEGGELSGNLFVSDELAGVDRVSLSGKAEPVEYSELLINDDLSGDFETTKVYFVVDDEVVQTVSKHVGAHVSKADFNANDSIELEDDEYITWDIDEDAVISGDMEIVGERTRYKTTLASDLTRESGQSVILVDGRFVQEDTLGVSRTSDEIEKSEKLFGAEFVTECYTIEIPNDLYLSHQVRYKMPDGVEKVTVEVSSGKEYEKVDTKMYGEYVIFPVSGNLVNLRITEAPGIFDRIDMPSFVVFAVAAVLGVIVLVIAVAKHRKKAKIVTKTEENPAGENAEDNNDETETSK